MNTIYDFNQLHESIINALEDSISDYEMLFSEEEWVYESPVKIDTPSERRAKAINNFLDGMVYIPSTNANIRDYNIMDMANHFDDIPAPTCSHDFCMHKSINSNVTEELGFGIFMFTKYHKPSLLSIMFLQQQDTSLRLLLKKK